MTELDPARVKELLASLDDRSPVANCEVNHYKLYANEAAWAKLKELGPDLATAWLASQEHIAALETTSRKLAAKLEECGPYLPHGSVRVELDALIAVLKETK